MSYWSPPGPLKSEVSEKAVILRLLQTRLGAWRLPQLRSTLDRPKWPFVVLQGPASSQFRGESVCYPEASSDGRPQELNDRWMAKTDELAG